MYDASGINRYREVDLNSIGPEKLIVMLYEAAQRDTRRARQALHDGDNAAKARCLGRVQSIITELRNALDHEIGGDISRNLEALYDFIFHEILELIIDGETSHFDNIEATLDPLLQAWRQVPVGSAEREAARRSGQDPQPETDSAPGSGPEPASDGERRAVPPPPEVAPRPYPDAPGTAPGERSPLLSVSA